ncbi:MAG TPA: NYN domain-containing protein [Ktedonobacterales bacterium]|nr:NYN domain-containing protein [Ktedonobacterales bacterium]
MTDEIALFIDFENIRYSLINVQHREPDPQELIALARQFGTVMVARAYADWTRQPEFFKGSLTAAMIDRVDCPAKVRERFRPNTYAPAFQQPYSQPSNGSDNALSDTDEEHDYADQDDSMLDADELVNAARGETPGDEVMLDGAPLDEEDDGDQSEEFAPEDERRGRYEQAGYQNGGYYQPQQPSVITQSTVDLNMLMDIIETVFDRPSINTYILMSGDRDFTRICARIKLRLNKRVIVIGVPGTVSRDLIAAAERFIPLGYGNVPAAVTSGYQGGYQGGGYQANYQTGYQQQHQPQPAAYSLPPVGPVEPDEPGFIQFLDYIDRHWSWRTIGGVANFIGDPFNPKNRFRGRLTRDSARDLLRACIDENILHLTTDMTGSENLRLNRQHPAVEAVLNEPSLR